MFSEDALEENVHPNTYCGHPVACAAGLANLDILEREGMIENSARMGELMTGHMERLQKKHPCVREHRNIGLFGLVELRKNAKNERLVPYAGSHPVMGKLGKFFRDEGLFTVLQWSTVMCNPPLSINEQQLAEGFEIVDRGLSIVDEVFEG